MLNHLVLAYISLTQLKKMPTVLAGLWQTELYEWKRDAAVCGIKMTAHFRGFLLVCLFGLLLLLFKKVREKGSMNAFFPLFLSPFLLSFLSFLLSDIFPSLPPFSNIFLLLVHSFYLVLYCLAYIFNYIYTNIYVYNYINTHTYIWFPICLFLLFS